MTGGAADLEAELAQRQKELEGDVAKHAKRTAQGLGATDSAPEFDPSEMVSKLNVGHKPTVACAMLLCTMHSCGITLKCKQTV